MSGSIFRWSGALAATTTLIAVPARAAVLEYGFNDPANGTSSVSTGTNTTAVTFKNASSTTVNLRSGDGLGVSGLAGDYAFNNSGSSGMGSAGTGGVAEHSADLDAIDGFQSFTVMMWVRVDSALDGNAAIINNQAGSPASGFSLRGNGGAARVQAQLDGTDVVSPPVLVPNTNTWTFIAVTYDGNATTNNVKYYNGTTTSTSSLVVSQASSAGALGDDVGGIFRIGNSAGRNRPVDGRIDNVRVIGTQTVGSSAGVLSLAQLEAYRLVDTKNATAALLSQNTPSGYGTSQGTLASAGGANGPVEAETSGDKGYVSLDLTPKPTDFRTLIALDIELSGTTTLQNVLDVLATAADRSGYTIVDWTTTPRPDWANGLTSPSDYEVLLDFGTTGETPNFAWDLSPLTSGANGATVDRVAVVPEPGIVAGVFLAGCGLVMGRRRRR